MKVTLTILCILLVVVCVSAQEFAVDKKASMVDGSFSFAAYGGDLYKNSQGNAPTVASLAGTYNYFVAKNIFVGGATRVACKGLPLQVFCKFFNPLTLQNQQW